MEKIIRNATENDIAAMQELWIECFPGDVEYSKFFFKRIFRLECARICEIGGEVAAMLHSFPYDFATPDGILHAKYIYGVGTAKKYRSRGIAGELLEAEASGCDFTVIIPQSVSLFDFYEKHGFTELFSVSKKIVKPFEKLQTVKAGKGDIEKLNALYEAMCAETIHPIRTRERWETIMDEFEFLGGGISFFDGGYCVYYEYDGERGISELCPGDATSPFGEQCPAITCGAETALGAARLISERAEKIFKKGFLRYLNLMHN